MKESKETNSDDPEEDTDEEECDNKEVQGDKEDNKSNNSMEYDPKNVHYEGELAIYTDPKTGYQYEWCKETDQWKGRSNMTYGFEDDTHTYTDAQGVKYFWDKEKSAWFPKIDDDFMARYQMSYGFVDNVSREESKGEEEKKEVPKKVEKKGEKRKALPQVASKCENVISFIYSLYHVYLVLQHF